MPPSTESPLGKFVPGFEFLQGLASNASSAIPGIGQWIAPTLDPDELEKRISELRTVQFWLEQNARLLATTIQALEVQRMTLAALKSMNVPVSDLRDSLHARSSVPAPPPAPAASKPGAAESAAVDPMQWWGALTQQFTQLAASAMKETLQDHRPAAAGPSGPAAAKPPARPAAAKTSSSPPTRRTSAADGASSPPAAQATSADKTGESRPRRRERSPGSPTR
jgi:hypothetical protein